MAENEPKPADGGNADGGGKGVSDRIPVWVQVGLALVITAVLLMALRSMWDLADDKDVQAVWDKRMVLYEGVFTLASLVLGAVFGAAVYRPQAQKAEQKADQARQVAQQKSQEAATAVADTERVRTDILSSAIKSSMSPTQLTVPGDPASAPAELLGALDAARRFDGPVIVNGPSSDPVAPPQPLVTLDAVTDAIDASR